MAGMLRRLQGKLREPLQIERRTYDRHAVTLLPVFTLPTLPDGSGAGAPADNELYPFMVTVFGFGEDDPDLHKFMLIQLLDYLKHFADHLDLLELRHYSSGPTDRTKHALFWQLDLGKNAAAAKAVKAAQAK